ncbi:hypothetical protein [Pseudooctadecabacter sp.]|uniref:hypothetical protein n=1 Tax=Pseudooctadecabacter sp. TaxID=1966338 RepID=UPI0035C7D1C8
MKKGDGNPPTEKQMQGSDFAVQHGTSTKLTLATFDDFADALEANEAPNENLSRLFDLRC